MNKKTWCWLAFFIALGAIPRFPQTFYGLPAACYPDSSKTVGVAERLSDQWNHGRWVLDPGTYQYPTLYLYTLAVLYKVIGRNNNEEFLGRAVAAVAGLLSAVPVCLLCAEISGPLAGVAGAGLMAFGFLFIEQGRYPIPDPLQMFWVGVALYFLLRKQEASLRDMLISGLCAGLAAGTKYTALIFLVPALAARRKGLWSWLVGCGAGFLIAVPTILSHFRDFSGRLALESLVQKSGETGAQPAGLLNYLFSNNVTPEGAPFANSLAGTMGTVFVLFALAALLWTGWRGWRDKDPRRAALFLSGLLSFIFFSTYSRIQAMRFLLPWALVIAIVVALAITDASQILSTLCHRRIRPLWIALALELGLLLPSFGMTVNYIGMLSHPDTRLQSAIWIFNHVPRGQKIFMLMWGPVLPPGDYPVLHASFPEYWFQIKNGSEQAPQLKVLADRGVSWVIWDSFYTRRLISPYSTGGSAYFQGWRDFYADLQHSSKKVFEAHGEVSPDIEIYQLLPHNS